MTAVIYARYSSDNQREESIEGQIRECTAYAEKNGITIVKHYIDRALSAKTDNRPEFQQMIKDSEKRLFDIVLVWKLDRFARNRYDSAHYEYQLERNHVKLVSATEPISEGPAGIMVKSMLTGMAEYYSAELSEKVVRGMTENVLKGKYNGGTIPIGYTVDEEKFFQIDPLKAPFVVEVFQRYNDGATMKELMNWLNDSGVTTNRNQKFTYNSIQTLLTNRRYIGENRFKDIVMPDSIPVIIEKELFDSVQDKIAKNRRAPARHKAEDDYLLTTKLFCGMCGAMMFGECGTSRNKNVHHYYKCANAKRTKTCKKKTVRKEWLEDLVVNETMKMIRDDDSIQSIVDAVMILQEQENTVLPLLEKQMKDIENGIENLLNAIQAGVLTSSTKGRLEKLEAQQKELEIRIAEEKLAKPKVSADFVKFWLTNFRKLDPNVKSHRETLINTFVNAVYLYDEKVLITFNYKDGTKTITFDEIAAKDAPEGNGSDLGCFAPAEYRPVIPDRHRKLHRQPRVSGRRRLRGGYSGPSQGHDAVYLFVERGHAAVRHYRFLFAAVGGDVLRHGYVHATEHQHEPDHHRDVRRCPRLFCELPVLHSGHRHQRKPEHHRQLGYGYFQLAHRGVGAAGYWRSGHGAVRAVSHAGGAGAENRGQGIPQGDHGLPGIFAAGADHRAVLHCGTWHYELAGELCHQCTGSAHGTGGKLYRCFLWLCDGGASGAEQSGG